MKMNRMWLDIANKENRNSCEEISNDCNLLISHIIPKKQVHAKKQIQDSEFI